MDDMIELEPVADTTDVNDTDNVQLPVNILRFGEIESDDVRVYIKQSVYKALETYAAADTSHERGTILLGSHAESLGKTHIVISDYIEARYTDASASTLTFTHETWEYVNREHEEKYPEEKIVGWQHTHPNYGIFLSNYDMFIQENFFNLPFQTAYVIDPIQKTRGFFQWKNGRVEKLHGFYIYDDVGKAIKIAPSAPPEQTSEAAAKPAKGIYVLTALLGVLAAASVITTCCLYGIMKRSLSEQAALSADKDTRIAALTDTINDLDERVAKQELAFSAHEADTAIPDTVPDDEDTVTFRTHTVQAGDTLSGICDALGVDYAANERVILAVNGLKSADRILIGQQLLIPAEY